MKQVITLQQLAELTSDQKEELEYWTVQKLFVTDHFLVYSVAHLMWFLDERIGPGWWHIERTTERNLWRVNHKSRQDLDENGEAELVDALWKAVKLVLQE